MTAEQQTTIPSALHSRRAPSHKAMTTVCVRETFIVSEVRLIFTSETLHMKLPASDGVVTQDCMCWGGGGRERERGVSCERVWALARVCAQCMCVRSVSVGEDGKGRVRRGMRACVGARVCVCVVCAYACAATAADAKALQPLGNVVHDAPSTVLGRRRWPRDTGTKGPPPALDCRLAAANSGAALSPNLRPSRSFMFSSDSPNTAVSQSTASSFNSLMCCC